MKITNFTQQKHNTEKYNIYMDDKYYCSLSSVLITKYNIYVGQIVDDNMIEEWLHDDEPNLAYLNALNYISFSMKTEKELRQKLKEKKFCSSSIDYAIKKCKEYNYIDDFFYAKSYIREKFSYCHWGENKIKEKLILKGIKSDVINDLLETCCEENKMVENAIIVGLKKKRSLEKYEVKKQKEKMFAFLVSRGFKYPIVKKAIENIFNEELEENSYEI